MRPLLVTATVLAGAAAALIPVFLHGVDWNGYTLGLVVWSVVPYVLLAVLARSEISPLAVLLCLLGFAFAEAASVRAYVRGSEDPFSGLHLFLWPLYALVILVVVVLLDLLIRYLAGRASRP